MKEMAIKSVVKDFNGSRKKKISRDLKRDKKSFSIFKDVVESLSPISIHSYCNINLFITPSDKGDDDDLVVWDEEFISHAYVSIFQMFH